MMTQKNEFVIRLLGQKDIEFIATTFIFPWTTLHATQEKWQRYYQEQLHKLRSVFLVQKDAKIIGYSSLLYKSSYAHFYQNNIPEIQDLWILEAERRTGFGFKLINYIEYYAKESGYQQIGLGVGLYKDYGSAQRLYVKNGYVPDGNGITYKNESVVPGKSYPVDDDLILWMIKDL